MATQQCDLRDASFRVHGGKVWHGFKLGHVYPEPAAMLCDQTLAHPRERLVIMRLAPPTCKKCIAINKRMAAREEKD
mgnify:CR=1 FL=1